MPHHHLSLCFSAFVCADLYYIFEFCHEICIVSQTASSQESCEQLPALFSSFGG